MKKFFALLLALAMILALSACGEKQQEPSNEGDEQDNTPAQTFNLRFLLHRHPPTLLLPIPSSGWMK